MPRHPVNLTFVLSLPRSGSTLLTAMLDKRKGIICMPESSFPQVLGKLSPKDRGDAFRMASFYQSSTFVPTPLTLEEAALCMKGDNEQILVSLGLAVAAKTGRDPADVSNILWKTTRTIGMNEAPIATSGKFIVLRRHPLNVFESQFRVGFGENNRRPWRFSLFLQSYEHAFARLPKGRLFELEYERIPDQLSELLNFLGVEDRGEWGQGVSSFESVAERCSWLNEITGKFNNRDQEKRMRLAQGQVRSLERALAITRPFRNLMGPFRSFFDQKSFALIIENAKKLKADVWNQIYSI